MVERADERVAAGLVVDFESLVRRHAGAGKYEMAAAILLAAVLALFLAAVGVYSAVSQSAASRTKEFGIRLALGASRVDIVLLVLREALATSMIAVPLGGTVLYLQAKLIGMQDETVGTVHLLAFLTGSLVVALMTVAVSLAPAIRAASADPSILMRIT